MGLINQKAMAGMGGKLLGMESELKGPASGHRWALSLLHQPCLLREETLTQQWGWPAPLLHPMGCPSGAPITYLLPSHPTPCTAAAGTPHPRGSRKGLG